MSMHRGVRYALAAAALSAATVVSAATPGVAATRADAATSPCPFSGTVCLFDQTGYNGARFTVSSLVPNGTCVSLVDHGWGGGRVLSGLNTNSSSAALFANDDCIGGPYQLAGKSGIPNFGGFQANSIWVP
ncbi:peptidase inhibitor family I36 protein [Micromonospora okii]|uniref:peptidase inhibitor family I36 protein n=1 Tax=Micromonospora okii TaxID=1182970 RepID=UPI001E33EB91|nr:peptidase inhibitor family I36 protein [Micromonospora okii]